MICPHCGEDLLYRERGGRKCSKCKRPFAFEPKRDPFHLNDVRFRKITNKLSQNNTLNYTVNQLRYQLARAYRDIVPPGWPTMKLVSTVIRIVVSILVAILGTFGIVVVITFFITDFFGEGSIIVSMLSIIFGLLVFFGVLLTGVYDAFPKPGPEISLKDFDKKVLRRWKKFYGEPPPGLVSEQQLQKLASSVPPPHDMRAVVVCPERDVLNCLLANSIPRRFSVGLLPRQGPFTPEEEATLAMLRQRPEVPLLLLHDASAAGCLLPKTIISAFKLRAYHKVVDLGLRPGQVARMNLFEMRTSAPDNVLKVLNRFVAPQGTPSDTDLQQKNYLLFYEEFQWLKNGHYSPIMLVSPARLIRAVSQAMQRLERQSVAASTEALPDPEEQAQEQARAVGFMSWPSA
jgi:hypothetical protein